MTFVKILTLFGMSGLKFLTYAWREIVLVNPAMFVSLMNGVVQALENSWICQFIHNFLTFQIKFCKGLKKVLPSSNQNKNRETMGDPETSHVFTKLRSAFLVHSCSPSYGLLSQPHEPFISKSACIFFLFSFKENNPSIILLPIAALKHVRANKTFAEFCLANLFQLWSPGVSNEALQIICCLTPLSRFDARFVFLDLILKFFSCDNEVTLDDTSLFDIWWA